MARLKDLTKSWTAWWMVCFMIAQSFQLINAAGYALVEPAQGAGLFIPIIQTYYASR